MWGLDITTSKTNSVLKGGLSLHCFRGKHCMCTGRHIYTGRWIVRQIGRSTDRRLQMHKQDNVSEVQTKV